MSLKALLRAGKELLKAKKPSATPTTGEQTRQITYTPKPSQAQAKELVTQELKNISIPIIRFGFISLYIFLFIYLFYAVD